MPRTALALLHHVRRRATRAGMHGALRLGRRLRPEHALGLGSLAGRLAGLPGPLRLRLARNMRRAGLEPTGEQLDRYFHLLGRWFGQSLALYQRGFADSGIAEQIVLDGSVARLQEALAQGRGAIVAEWHYHCHEIALAALARRFPVTVIVRDHKDPAHAAVKRRWYAACGMETITRAPHHGVKLAAAFDYLAVLRDNKVLVVSPDALGPADQGVPVELFGRRVGLQPGLVALAMITGAPVLFSWPDWQLAPDRLTVRFDEPLTFSRRGDRAATRRAGLQEWATRLEALLRRRPEYWMHWLDKQWSRVWRGER
jgi:lauroyl/myristoyl acyltransferase